MKILCITFLSFLGVAYGGTTQEANMYVDALLFEKLPVELKADTVALPDFNTTFTDKIFFISYDVNTQYTSGVLHGVSRPTRARDCTPPIYIASEIRLNCTLVFNQLHLDYNGHAKYGKFPSIGITVHYKFDPTYLALELSSNNQGKMGKVRSLTITSHLNFVPEFSGLGPANIFIQSLRDTFLPKAKENLLNAFNGKFKLALDNIVRSATLPKP